MIKWHWILSREHPEKAFGCFLADSDGIWLSSGQLPLLPPQLLYSWASVSVNAFGQTEPWCNPAGFFVGPKSLWVTCWHGTGAIGNWFTSSSEGQKIQSFSAYPCAGGKLVTFLWACLELHLGLVPRRPKKTEVQYGAKETFCTRLCFRKVFWTF